jgi:PKD repeat protein
MTVGSATGSCDFQIKDDQGARISFDPVSSSYDAAAGKQLTFDAVGFTGTASWDFGDGTFGTGDLATHTYTSISPQNGYVVTLTATGCSRSYTIFISGASLDFSVADADTGTTLASPAGSLEARAGQPLKFTAAGATGAVSWDFGDGQFSAEASPVKTYAPLVDTTYRVILTSNGQSTQKNLLVKGSTGAALTGNFTVRYADGTAVTLSAVQPNKPITFTGADQATTYTWDFGDGSALQLGSPRDYAFTRGGTFTVKLTVARNEVPGSVTTPSPLALTVLAPPDPLLWVAAGMAYIDGGNGERWQSDLSVYNPGSQTATISLGFVAGASWDGASTVDWITEAIPVGQTRTFANVRPLGACPLGRGRSQAAVDCRRQFPRRTPA